MSIELKIPAAGESITEVEIGDWLKKQGDPVEKDEPLVTIESEKATVELPAPEAGVLVEIRKQKGEVARVGEVIASIQEGARKPQPPQTRSGVAVEQEAAQPKPKVAPQETGAPQKGEPVPRRVMPAAERILAQRQLQPETIEPTGPGGRVLKEDVERYPERAEPAPHEVPPAEPRAGSQPAEPISQREEETVPMSRLRRTIAERLVEAQNTSALLTTFNEVDLTEVLALRKRYGEAFQQKYRVKLGFMSFFVKACIEGLKQFPVLNAEVRGTNVVYHNFFDIGVAIGGGKGLVVPVLRNAERMSFAEIESAIGDLARRAKENKLKVEELQGGTFTISNGGVYGSLLSTPLVNPPQSGVLGMHAIQDRPVVREGVVVVRPMMYLALTYDHRIVDGREGVTFLKRIRDVIENPARMLMEI